MVSRAAAASSQAGPSRVKACDAEIVELLVWAGADRSKRDAQQATALELARRLDRRGSHAAIISALEATIGVCQTVDPAPREI